MSSILRDSIDLKTAGEATYKEKPPASASSAAVLIARSSGSPHSPLISTSLVFPSAAHPSGSVS